MENIRDIYYIRRNGQVYSFGNYGSDVKGEPKVLKQYTKTGGYLNVALMTNESKVRYLRVHRLVALAYVENPDGKEYVNHIDENRTNNHYSNLSWVTPKENNLHSMRKPVFVYTFSGELEKVYSYSRECVKDGYNQGHVCSCARGEIRSHKKRIFSYVEMSKDEVVQRLSKPHYLLKGDRRKK